MKKIAFVLSFFTLLVACQTTISESSTTNTTSKSSRTANTTSESETDTTSVKTKQAMPSANDTETIVAQIRERYQHYMALDKAKKLQKRTLTYMCEVFEGTVQYVLNEKNELLWIEHTWGGDHFHQTHQYFLYQDKLFFYFIKEGSWNFDPENYDEKNEISHTVDSFIEKRYYFDVNENIVHCLKKDYQVFSAKKDNPKSENIANQAIDCPDTKVFFERLHKLREVLPAQKQSKRACIEGIEGE